MGLFWCSFHKNDVHTFFIFATSCLFTQYEKIFQLYLKIFEDSNYNFFLNDTFICFFHQNLARKYFNRLIKYFWKKAKQKTCTVISNLIFRVYSADYFQFLIARFRYIIAFNALSQSTSYCWSVTETNLWKQINFKNVHHVHKCSFHLKKLDACLKISYKIFWLQSVLKNKESFFISIACLQHISFEFFPIFVLQNH